MDRLPRLGWNMLGRGEPFFFMNPAMGTKMKLQAMSLVNERGVNLRGRVIYKLMRNESGSVSRLAQLSAQNYV